MAEDTHCTTQMSDDGDKGCCREYLLPYPPSTMGSSSDMTTPRSGRVTQFNCAPPLGLEFQGPGDFGNVINDAQFEDAMSTVICTLESGSKRSCNGGIHRERGGRMPFCYCMLSRSVDPSDDIFANSTYAQSFKDPTVERLYGLNVSNMLQGRYMVANVVMLLVTLATWAVVTSPMSPSELAPNGDSKFMENFNMVTIVTCCLLLAPAWPQRFARGEYSCYISYTLVMVVWSMWNHRLQMLSYRQVDGPRQTVVLEVLLWVSNFVFGLGLIMVMDLFLRLRSCWTALTHLFHVGFHLMSVITPLSMQSRRVDWEYGVLKFLIHMAMVGICFWSGCHRELELRLQFLTWAVNLATSTKADVQKSNDHFPTVAERLYDDVHSCGELLQNIQCMVESKHPNLQQHIQQLNQTIQNCIDQMRSGDNLYEISYEHMDVEEEQLEVMDAYVWGSKERTGTRAFTSVSNLDTDLESQVARGFGVSFTQLWPQEVDVIKPLDRSMLISDWNFDVLEHFRRTEWPFITLGYGLLSKYQVQCDVEKVTVFNFLSVLECLYRDVPYHNRIHGAMVAQKIMCLANYIGLIDKMTILEEAVMVVSALAHDVGHPARNNAFFVRSNHPVAQMYNDNAVLENYHAACTFKILRITDCNLFAGFDYDSFRSQLIELILATDTVDHFQMLSQFNLKCTSADFSFDDPKNRSITGKMLIKAADVSAPTMLWEASLEWSERLMGEFYSQGDEEATLGIPISALCDRSHHDQLAKSQAAFLKIVVSPLYQSIALVKKSPEIDMVLNQLEENSTKWQEMQNVGETISCYDFDGYKAALDVSWVASTLKSSQCDAN